MTLQALIDQWRLHPDPEVGSCANQLAGWLSEQGWQPIATAPKDCELLLYGEYTSGARGLVQGAWNDGGAMHMPHWMGGIIRPTHWMPLPAAPRGGGDTPTVGDENAP